MKEYIEVIFFGDIIGRPGRYAVAKYLNELENKPDFVIANVENASHGFGLTEKNYNELVNIGINALTSGNHIWDKNEIFKYIDKADRLVRPLNYPEGTPGVGSRIFKVGEISICVINVLGRIFMSPMDSPWTTLENEIKKNQYETPIIIIDFHAEATAEKISLGYFADRLGISAFIGTHTHIQTADEKFLENNTAYITDVGCCGASKSVIGMDIETSVKRLKTGLPVRFEVASLDESQINAVRILIKAKTGCAEKIERINYFIKVSEVKD
ncbi:MAG: TIGR00282 family metallophosphoesterase [bacterium]